MVDLSDIIDRFPPIIPRESDSTIRRFIEAFQDDTDELGESLDDIQDSRFIDKASGEDLDRIGAQFGPLGNRAGRDDQEYRTYLKSLVSVFEYRGTVPGIRAAVAAGLGIDDGINGGDADLSIYEHFNDDPANQEEYLEYTITLDEWSAHRGSTIETLAELSDSSVSRLRKVTYNFEDSVGFSDSTNILEGQNITDNASIDDAVLVNSDNPTITDDASIDDAVLVNSDNPTITDDASADDAVTVIEQVGATDWNESNANWDFFEWS